MIKHSKPRQTQFIIAILITLTPFYFFSLFALPFHAVAQQDANIVGIVKEVRGNVFRTPSQSETRIRLQEGDAIKIADLIVTGDDAFVKINSDDEMLFVLAGNSVLLVQDVLFDDENDGTVIYSIIKGGFMMIAGPNTKRHRGAQMQTTAGNIELDGTIIAGNIFSNGTAYHIGLIEGGISFTPSNTDQHVKLDNALTMIGGDAASDDVPGLSPIAMDLRDMVKLFQSQFSVLNDDEIGRVEAMLKSALELEGRDANIDGVIAKTLSQNNTDEGGFSSLFNLPQNPKQYALEDIITQKALDNAKQSTPDNTVDNMVDNDDNGLLGSGAPSLPPNNDASSNATTTDIPPIFTPFFELNSLESSMNGVDVPMVVSAYGIGIMTGEHDYARGNYIGFEHNDGSLYNSFYPSLAIGGGVSTKLSLGGDDILDYGQFVLDDIMTSAGDNGINTVFQKGWYLFGDFQDQSPWLSEQIGGSASYHGVIKGDIMKDGISYFDRLGGTFSMNVDLSNMTYDMDFNPTMTSAVGPNDDMSYHLKETSVTGMNLDDERYGFHHINDAHELLLEGNFYGEGAQATGGHFIQEQDDIQLIGIFASQ